ncbi:Ig-like domain-containing protein, partial [Gammaproteobacteria bacterium AS21]
MASNNSRTNYSRVAIERRVMFDGAAVTTVDQVDILPVESEAVSFDDSSPNVNIQASNDELEAVLESGISQSSVYFIDNTLPDVNGLISYIPENSYVVMIDGKSDGLEQVKNTLSGMSSVDTIHIISHSSASGDLQIGNSLLNAESVNDQYADTFNEINHYLSANADVLIYGCDLAETEEGKETLSAIADALESDVAASDDITGIDGDWALEYQLGAIESSSIVAEDWQHNLLVNSSPVATADLVNIGEGYTAIINVLENDFDPDGDELTVLSASAISGDVTINPDNTIVYIPNNGFVGTDTITYVIEDSNGASSLPGAVEVVVIPSIDLPVINLPTIELLTEDTPLVFADLGVAQISVGNINGTVADVSLSVPVGSFTLTQNAGVTLSGGDGVNDNNLRLVGDVADVNLALESLVYTPDADYNGPVTISIGLTDELLSVPVTVVLPISIGAVSDIVDDGVNTPLNIPISFNVLENDTFENVSATITSYTEPSHGAVSHDGFGNMIYTPDTDYTGIDTFSYTVTSNGTVETATVTIAILGPNTLPQISFPVDESVSEDATLTFSSVNENAIIINDVDGDTLTVTLENTNGLLSLSGIVGLTFLEGDGSSDSRLVFSGSQVDINTALEGMTFVPDTNFNGNTDITLLVNDGNSGEDTASVVVTVNAVNDAPEVADSTATVNEDTAVTLDVLANASDADGDTLTITAATVPAAQGTVTIVDGKLVFTPAADFNG